MEKVADEDDRSMSAMIKRIVKFWLIEHGYLVRKDRE